jgi:hypothetical protein
MLNFVYYSFHIHIPFQKHELLQGGGTNMHPKQMTGDYFVSYTMPNFSAKQDKMHVGRITDAFCHLPLFHKFGGGSWNINVLSTQYITALKGLKNFGCGECLGI